MRLSDYSYSLPQALIAAFPPEIRGTSRLLVLDRQSGKINDSKYADIPDFLNFRDLLVLNDTKVIKARLKLTRQDGAERELVVLEKHSFDNDWHRHHVLYRKKIRVGDELTVGGAKLFVEEILGDGLAIVRSEQDLLRLTELYGKVPLPPYIHRDASEDDVERYQTVWADQQGSVAAPTASLNMTEQILHALREKGVIVANMTLHVGLGTFLPIRADNLEDHKMHQEYFEIPSETIQAIRQTKAAGGRVIALGTTVARALEYSHKTLLSSHDDITGEADIFIYPGYEFKVIDGLLTNFHTPKSTVLMLTAAFAGWENLKNAYQHAIDEKYHFLSYGDSMLIL